MSPPFSSICGEACPRVPARDLAVVGSTLVTAGLEAVWIPHSATPDKVQDTAMTEAWPAAGVRAAVRMAEAFTEEVLWEAAIVLAPVRLQAIIVLRV
jgi:hypothetical protein